MANHEPYRFASLGDTLYFELTPDRKRQGGRSIWTSDGTVAGTRQSPIPPSAFPFDAPAPNRLGWRRDLIKWEPIYEFWRWKNTKSTNVSGTHFFVVDSEAHGRELWTSNGSPSTNSLVKDINPGPGESVPTGMVEMDGILYFSAFEPKHGVELWRSDGTAAGTRMVKDINPGTEPRMLTRDGTVFDGHVAGLFAHEGLLRFSATDGVHGLELWQSDGTLEGTRMIEDVNPGPGDSAPGLMIGGGEQWGRHVRGWRATRKLMVGDSFYFVADDGVHGRELRRKDGANPSVFVLPREPYPGDPRLFVSGVPLELDGFFYFVGRGAPAKKGVPSTLWRTDGTPGGTIDVRDLHPDLPNYDMNWVRVLGQNLVVGYWHSLWVIPTEGAARGLQSTSDAARASRSETR